MEGIRCRTGDLGPARPRAGTKTTRRWIAVATMAALVGGSSAAIAADYTPIGRALSVRSLKSLKLRSKDGAALPAPAASPTAVGGTLIVTLTGGGGTQSESFNLPAAGWEAVGSPVVTYRFRQPKGPGVINSLRLRIGKELKAQGIPAALNLAQAPQLTGEAVLVIGGDRYCLDFGTVPSPNDSVSVRWSAQPSAGSCPSVPTTTTTTTSTTTTTVVCQFPVCGDGILCADAEQCDDGNTVSGDGCSSSCEFDGSTCTNAPIGSRLVVVSLNVPSNTPLNGVQLTLEYPQLQSSLPGRGLSSLVQSRVYTFPKPGPLAAPLTTLTFDSDTDLTTLVYAGGFPGSGFIKSGPLVAYEFDNCVPLNQGVCNRAQTVVDCCNDLSDPNQWNNPNFCNATTPTIPCPGGFDSECPARTNANCTAAGQPYACCTGAGTGSCDSTGCTGPGTPFACCTGAGTGNCEAIQLGCTGVSQPFPCCTGPGTGTCPPRGGSCNVKCPGNPPVCAVNFAGPTDIYNYSLTTVGPCAGKVCSNAPTRACLVDADCVAPGTCTGVQQPGACPGDNECKPQTSLTQCFLVDPVDYKGEVVANSVCTGPSSPHPCCTGVGTGTCDVTCSVTVL